MLLTAWEATTAPVSRCLPARDSLSATPKPLRDLRPDVPGPLEQIVALAVLKPVVASMGGVAGTQTLTLIVRGLALGQVNWNNARDLVTRELAIGGLNGLLWAAVVAIVAWAWFGDWHIAAVIAAASAALCWFINSRNLKMTRARRIGGVSAQAGKAALAA